MYTDVPVTVSEQLAGLELTVFICWELQKIVANIVTLRAGSAQDVKWIVKRTVLSCLVSIRTHMCNDEVEH